jgi:hypothetical protein
MTGVKYHAYGKFSKYRAKNHCTFFAACIAAHLTNCSMRCSQNTVGTGNPTIQHRIFFRLAGFFAYLRTSNTCRENTYAGKIAGCIDDPNKPMIPIMPSEGSVPISSQHHVPCSVMFNNCNDANNYHKNTRMWESKPIRTSGIISLLFHSCQNYFYQKKYNLKVRKIYLINPF